MTEFSAEFSATTAGIAAFGATAATLAEQVQAAGAASAASGPALLGPIFGAIGGDFVAAFTDAQTAHAAQLDHLASAWASMGDAALTTAAAYDTTEAGTTAALGETGTTGAQL
ncbi:type VII secretion target [Rhodococcus sp. ACT016]|uniref:type VII secretion target n=1 Tax=Rhodococcus sp. ACT016 TaxID=3134808 RepID=UPI003D2CE63B